VWTAVSGKSAIFKQLQIIANNLANVTTAGFRAERISFEKDMSKVSSLQTSLADDIENPSGLSPDEYVKINGSYTDLTQGSINRTGNALDAAIEGEGFFVLQTPEGLRYTRAGNFKLDAQQRIVSSEGYPVQGDGGDITLASGTVSIGQDGTITQNKEVVGKLQVVRIDPQDLLRESAQKFRLKDGASAETIEEPRIEGGAVEESNVNPVRELTEMIFAQRLFEALEKTNDSSSKMTRARNEVFGRQSV